MRTTLTIDDDLLQAAKSLAEAKSMTVGEVISELARKGLEAGRKLEHKSGLPIFSVGPGATVLTTERIRQAEDEPE